MTQAQFKPRRRRSGSHRRRSATGDPERERLAEARQALEAELAQAQQEREEAPAQPGAATSCGSATTGSACALQRVVVALWSGRLRRLPHLHSAQSSQPDPGRHGDGQLRGVRRDPVPTRGRRSPSDTAGGWTVVVSVPRLRSSAGWWPAADRVSCSSWPSACTCRRPWRPSGPARSDRRRGGAPLSPPRARRSRRSRVSRRAWPTRWTPSPPRSRRRHHPGARRLRRGRPVRHRAAHPRPPRSGRQCAPSSPTGCATDTTSAPPASTRPARPGRRWSSPATAASPRWRRCARRAPPASVSWSPITTSRRRAATRHRGRGPAAGRRRLRALRSSAAPASPSSWSRRWCRRSVSRRTCPTTCSTTWRWPPWPTWCRSRREPHPGAARAQAPGREPLARACGR